MKVKERLLKKGWDFTKLAKVTKIKDVKELLQKKREPKKRELWKIKLALSETPQEFLDNLKISVDQVNKDTGISKPTLYKVKNGKDVRNGVIGKLTTNYLGFPIFGEVEEEAPKIESAPKKRGRPPKVKTEERTEKPEKVKKIKVKPGIDVGVSLKDLVDRLDQNNILLQEVITVLEEIRNNSLPEQPKVKKSKKKEAKEECCTTPEEPCKICDEEVTDLNPPKELEPGSEIVDPRKFKLDGKKLEELINGVEDEKLSLVPDVFVGRLIQHFKTRSVILSAETAKKFSEQASDYLSTLLEKDIIQLVA